MRDRTVFAEELHSVIKAGCADFDLPVEVFGSKPMRKTMATNDRLKGVGREEANEKGKGSTCTRHYSHARAARAEGAGVAAGQGLILDEVRSIASEAIAARAAQAARRQKERQEVRGDGPAIRLREGGERRLAGRPDD